LYSLRYGTDGPNEGWNSELMNNDNESLKIVVTFIVGLILGWTVVVGLFITGVFPR